MPLRDHFHPPVSKRSSWEGLHGGWPAVIVQHLVQRLPDCYVAEPRTHLGAYRGTLDLDDEQDPIVIPRQHQVFETAAANAILPAPTLTLEAEFPEQYAYEVLIFDIERDRQLVAAIEIVSPANKDRPESRHLFVAKCFNLLRQNVCLSIVDLVTIRKQNLYAELLSMINRRDPTLGPPPPPAYAVTCRKRQADGHNLLDSWCHPIAIGQPLPTIPIWLSGRENVLVDLEASYEETCRVLRVP
jgi:hypothetical protein